MRAPSASRPASLREPTSRSLGHFSCAASPQASPDRLANGDAGRQRHQLHGAPRTMEIGEVEAGAWRRAPQVCPRRPRPAVCSSATTVNPAAAPASAAAETTSIVDGSDACHRTSNARVRTSPAQLVQRPRQIGRHRVCRRCRLPSAGCRLPDAVCRLPVAVCRSTLYSASSSKLMSAAGAECVSAPTDTNCAPVVAELRQPLQRDAAGDLDRGAAGDPLHRLADVVGGEVVEQDARRAGRQRLVEFVERLDLHLDRQARAAPPAPRRSPPRTPPASRLWLSLISTPSSRRWR